jgi:hypothetical protein
MSVENILRFFKKFENCRKNMAGGCAVGTTASRFRKFCLFHNIISSMLA